MAGVWDSNGMVWGGGGNLDCRFFEADLASSSEQDLAPVRDFVGPVYNTDCYGVYFFRSGYANGVRDADFEQGYLGIEN